MQQPRLLAGIRFDLQSLVVFPGNVQPSGHTHEVGSAIAFALFPGGFVLRRIPRIGDFPALFIERYSGIVAVFGGAGGPARP